MRQVLPSPALLWLLVVLLATPSLAVMSDEESPRPWPSTSDYADGLQALNRGDWPGVISSMKRVIARRPWDDDAHNLMGYAYRQLGDYPQALAHYQRALDLNPHHRGALEYLGETYLAMGCMAQAQAMLSRLKTACQRITGDGSAETWKSGCNEWQELNAAIERSHVRGSGKCRND
jgi:Flp pilus assembly protein TadD